MEKGSAPGAVLLVGHNGAVVYRKAYGIMSLEGPKEPMTPDTVFDMASLTKVLATTTSVMRMVQLGTGEAERSGSQVHSRVRAERQTGRDRPPVDDALLRDCVPTST